ncbi:MAG TPA: fibronectin type III domain-containing protein [Anaerolineales bacterium]
MTGRIGLLIRLLGISVILLVGSLVVSSSSHAANGYSPYLRRYPYLTDVVDSYATINWGTDRSNTTGGVRYGKAGSELCTAHYVPATTRAVINVNNVSEYQWSALLNLTPGTQYCYRVYLGSGSATEVDLLGTDASPVFWTQVPSGSTQPYSFDVIGDWGYVDTSGANAYQASLMSLIASSGARFTMTAGDNGYPSGSQTNYGDLVQTGANISAIFGPAFWKVPGSFTPIFPVSGNHGLTNPDPTHPLILNFPQTRAVALSGGRYVKETYCCIDGTTSANYPSAWYAFDAGLARIYVLDASWSEKNIGTASSPYQVDHDYHWTTGSPEYQWLQADLASHPSLIKLAVWHYPLYSDDAHQVSDTYLQGSGSLEGLLSQYGVLLAFQGHAHNYERNAPSPVGLPSYVSGGGGSPLGSLGTCTSLDRYALFSGASCNAPKPTSPNQVYHFLNVTVRSTGVTVSPVNSLGSTFDIVTYPVPGSGDATAPSVPAGLVASPATNGTEVDLSWLQSTDNTAVRGYDIYRNGVLISQTDAATLTYADIGLSPATAYTYAVDAFDGSGNHSVPSLPASVTTPTTATYVFTPVADSYVAGDNTTINYGTSAVLKADGSPDYHTYLRFNVGEMAGTVTRATLSLYATSSSSIGYQVKTVSSNLWDEGTVTYANAPALGLLVGSSGPFQSATWVSVDVTSLITGNGIYDLGVSTTSTSSVSFNSRDATSNMPQLTVQTTAVLPTATPTATATAPAAPTSTPTSGPPPTDTPTSAPLPTDTPTSAPFPSATPTSLPAPTATPTAVSLPVFSDGFESGDLSAWTSSAGLSVESTTVHTGLYAAEGNTTNGNTYAKKTLASTYADGYARIYFNLVSYASQVNLLRLRTSTGTSIGYLFVSTSGQLGLRNDAAATTTTSTTIVTSGWHMLELHATINGASSITEVWLDGVKINSLSLTTNLGTTPIGAIQIGEVQSARTYDVIFDDIVFDTQWIGP